MRRTDGRPARVDHDHGIPTRSAATIKNVTRKYPRMSGLYAIDAFTINADGLQAFSLKLSVYFQSNLGS